MPGTTPVYGFPYPLDNDPVYQGAKHIRDIAQRLESTLTQTGPAPAGTEIQTISQRLLALEAATADSGWQNIVLNPGYEWRPGYTGKVRRMGPIVYVWGQIAMSRGVWGSSTVKLTLPAGFRPDGESRADQVIDGTNVFAWYRTSGELVVSRTTVDTGWFIINAQFFVPEQ